MTRYARSKASQTSNLKKRDALAKFQRDLSSMSEPTLG
jgi:hypothetical protein